VEVADSAEERTRGLMFREGLPEDEGMLFVFDGDTTSGFWMKDTLIPLSIAFLTSDGAIIDIQDLEPLDVTLHYAPSPHRWAVEANRGWFERNGVQVGDQVELPVLPVP